MNKLFNFCAGPAMLPVDVMLRAKNEFLNWNDQGCSVMELSHRSKPYIQLAEKAEHDLRCLLNVPNSYKVLFTHGGGRAHFSAVPLNLTNSSQTCDYLETGSWSVGAAKEASRYLRVNRLGEGLALEDRLNLAKTWQPTVNSAYCHYCPNETVDGIEIDWVPDTQQTPLIADMSSNILSKEIDVSKFGLIYAGAQKNIGPSGLSVVIIREDLLGKARKETPAILNYSLISEFDSMYNTPPTYAWYLAGLVFEWLLQQGGVAEMQKRNKQKADYLYNVIDNNDFYINKVPGEYRSRMNVTFHLANDSLDGDFVKQAENAGLKALKGHRSVGWMRASIYNAMPFEGVQVLGEFLQDYAKRNG
jgi:phosphoserine aminotransferase